MEKNMIAAENVTPGMEIAFDIMGNTVCITPEKVKVVGWTCEFRSETTHRIVVEPCTMVEVLSSPVPEPRIIGSRVLAGNRPFLLVSDTSPNSSSWVDVITGKRYKWADLREQIGAITVLDDDPVWTVDSSKNEPKTVESLDDADKRMIYRDKDGDLWAYDESEQDDWTLYEADYGATHDPRSQPFKPVARKGS